jgi:hypothetical protein
MAIHKRNMPKHDRLIAEAKANTARTIAEGQRRMRELLERQQLEKEARLKAAPARGGRAIVRTVFASP